MVGFAGESFLEVRLPDYERAGRFLSLYLAAAAVFWIAVAPLLCTRKEEKIIIRKVKEELVQNNKKTKRKKGSKRSDASNSSSSSSPGPMVETVRTTEKTIPPYVSAVSTLGFALTAGYLVLAVSPHNAFAPRGVFQAPLFTAEECAKVVEMAHAAADANYQRASKDISAGETNVNATAKALAEEEPVGWQKTRHGSYPTTDLNLVTDPFTASDRAWIGNLLDRRLAPLLSRVFGVPPTAIRANDLFVVRYDHDKRSKLVRHTDDSDISFNMLLNRDFEGTLLDHG
jgi:type IV secretory pathway protease TraF